MKKILLASTMLAGTAGFAAAEMSMTGYAELGVVAPMGGDTQFFQQFEVKFIGTGSSDAGLEFGAGIQLDEVIGDKRARNGDFGDAILTNNDEWNDDNGWDVWVSGAFGKLTLGDTDGALDWALADMDGGLTTIADDHTTHAAWFGGADLDGKGDGQILRYENSFGDVAFAISAEQGDDGANAPGEDDTYGIGVKYKTALAGSDLALGLAYQDAGVNGSGTGVSVKAGFAGGFSAALAYIDFGGNVVKEDSTGADAKAKSALGAEVNYTTGDLSLNLNYGFVDFAGTTDVESFGAAVNYDLGGGAVVMAGYTDGKGADKDQWSLGLGLSF